MGRYAVFLLAVLIALTACTTRSISNSGYPDRSCFPGDTHPLYKGELSAFAVLGIGTGTQYTAEEINRAYESASRGLALGKGDAILLIQSGAMVPDEGMSDTLRNYFRVVPFTGVPEQGANSSASYSDALRFAAASAGIDKIIVYRGMLESEVNRLGTNIVSWVPIIGGVIPDETQSMRIRLKIGVIDVRSGVWGFFVPSVSDDGALSAGINRVSSDQGQVARLKLAAYEAAGQAILHRYER